MKTIKRIADIISIAMTVLLFIRNVIYIYTTIVELVDSNSKLVKIKNKNN